MPLLDLWTHRFACRQDVSQFPLLTRHFFGRLFRNDFVDFEDQVKERLIAVLAILAAFFGYGSIRLLFKYYFLADVSQSWQEKGYFFSVLMILFGIVTLIEWDVLFPDRRDYLNLTPLPVRLRTLFAAKLASLVLFVGLFSTAMNSLASAVFAVDLAPRRSASVLFLARYALAHLASAFAACFFVFFGLVFLQSVLMAVLPVRTFRRVSLFVRFALTAALTFLLLAFLVKPVVLGSALASLPELMARRAPFVFRFPPLWFSGLYEVLLGTRDPVFRAQAGTACLAFLFSLVGFAMASALSYYRHVVKTLETGVAAGRFARFWEGLAGACQGVLMRTPEERAVSAFFSKTIRQSPKHRMALGAYLAAATAVALLFVAGYGGRPEALTPDNTGLLMLPLVFASILLAGLRSVIDQPVAPEANWVFEVTESAETSRYISGFKKVIFVKWILPLFAAVFALHLGLWSFGTALGHAAYGLTLAALGLEALFLHFRKIPFACATVPGKAKLHMRGVVFVLAFYAFLEICAAIEHRLLKQPRGFIVFFALAAGIWAAIRANNARFLRGKSLLFEEEPEPVMVVFPKT